MTLQYSLKLQPSRTKLLVGTGALLLILACSLVFANRASAHGWINESRAGLCNTGQNTNCGAVQYEPWSVEGRGDFPEIGVPDGEITGGGKYAPLFEQSATRWTKVNMTGGPYTFHWKMVANHSTNRWDYYITKPGWDPNKPIGRDDLELFCRYEDNGAIPPMDVLNDCYIPNDREGYHVIIGVWDIFDTVNAFYQAIDVNLTKNASLPSTPPAGFPGDPNRFGNIRDWSSIRPYNAGEQVVWNGYIWQAQYYTSGQEPGVNSVWKQVGPVGGTTTAPAAPAGLTATAGNGQVSLAWSPSSGATSYTVKRATTSGGPYTNVATNVTASSYVNTGLTNGTTYYFVVSATNSAGSSANSTQASATPAGSTTTQPPAAPTGLTAIGMDGHVMLSWSASTGATSYTVKRATTTGGPYTNIANVTTNSYTDMSLTNGTTYYYVVSASNTGGSSANSAQASGTPTAGVTMNPPAAPASITATAGNAQVALTWAASADATSYTVKRATTTGGPYTNIATVTTNSYTNTGLTNGTTYYYVVSASNSNGSSANSAQASATPAGGTTTPSSLVVQYKTGDTNASDNQIKAHFNIKNTGTSALDLTTVKIRYYFTKDSSSNVNAFIDWAQVGNSNVKVTVGTATGTNADTYVEISFTSGSIAAGGQSGDIQVRLAKADWSNFNESNDYSYDGTKTAYADWNKVTATQGGTLVWGTTP
ncbi:lytic polysaccharide monooxygenase [Paenibacillus kobensis]|uniref:lytic polysaccharide monooxygenase n=1 Tax=Paenibacillus kobensis TaxID=59841 RepID=UPI001FE5F561|nr:lytic polysaccharide monooxygenase [Paenibacillus kobensis]